MYIIKNALPDQFTFAAQRGDLAFADHIEPFFDFDALFGGDGDKCDFSRKFTADTGGAETDGAGVAN